MTKESPLNANEGQEDPKQEALGNVSGTSYKNLDRFLPLALLVVLAVAYSQIINLPVGSLGAPGAGLWPTIIALGTAILIVFYSL